MTILTDPTRGMVQPSRIKLQTVTTAGDFKGVYASLPGNLIPAEEAAVVNGLELDEPVMKGQWLKVIEKVKRP
jgi:predicted Zn-dependent protease